MALLSLLYGLSPKAANHALVNLARDAHIVEVVLAYLRKFSGLIQIEDFAAFRSRGLARFDPHGPGDIVKTDKTFRAQPPVMHGVKYTAHPELGKINQRLGRNAVDQAALKNKRQVETDQVVADQFVCLAIKVFHELKKSQQRFLLVLLNAIFVDAKYVLAVWQLNAQINSGDRTRMYRDGKYAARSRAQRSKLIAAFFFDGDVFEISLLLFQPHVSEFPKALELRPNPFAKVRQRQCLDVHRVRARQHRIRVLMFAILLEGNRAIFGNHKLRAILISFEFASDTKKSWLKLFPDVERLAPNFQRQRAGRITRNCIAEDFSLLRALFAH